MRVRPIALSLALSTICSSTTFSSSRRRPYLAWPTGAGPHVSAINFASATPSNIRGRAHLGLYLRVRTALETFLDKLPSRSLDSGDARIQRLGDPAIAPPLAGFRNIGFQQNTRFRDKLGRTLALADKLIELAPFLPAQIHHIHLER